MSSNTFRLEAHASFFQIALDKNLISWLVRRIRTRDYSVCKKLKSDGGFLSYLQDKTANPANMAAIFWSVLVGLKKQHCGNQAGMENAVNGWKDILLYFITLEIYCWQLQ